MTEFYNPDLFIYKIKYWIIFGIILIVVIGRLYLPSGDFIDPYPNEEEKVALNFAATVAQAIWTHYAQTDSTGFIGLSTEYGGIIQFDHDWYDRNKKFDHYKIDIKVPDDYKCEILDSLVIVNHIDGAKGEVRWR